MWPLNCGIFELYTFHENTTDGFGSNASVSRVWTIEGIFEWVNVALWSMAFERFLSL
jgi:hypothetical protein